MPHSEAKPTSPAPAGVVSTADNDTELFEVVNELNRPIRLVARSEVHGKGLAHRATHIFLFHPINGDVLLQRRSPRKRIGPGCWDLSCAEHNAPGETYRQSAVRGLKEELGIVMEEEKLKEVREVFLNHAVYADDFIETEYIGTFWATYDGDVKPDRVEVTDTGYWPVDKILITIKENPEKFTPWLLMQLASINLEQLSRNAQEQK